MNKPNNHQTSIYIICTFLLYPPISHTFTVSSSISFHSTLQKKTSVKVSGILPYRQRYPLFLSNKDDDDDFDDEFYFDPQQTNQQRVNKRTMERSAQNRPFKDDTNLFDEFEYETNSIVDKKRNGKLMIDSNIQNDVTEDEYYYDYDDFDDDDDDDNEDLGDGNYWINESKNGVDTKLMSSRKRSRSNEMDLEYEDVYDDFDDDFDDDYDDFPRPSRRSKRSTFRSGTPEPPLLLKNFYDSFFWYGMDMSQSTNPSDKTIFGGTQGKFNGLDLVNDSSSKRGRNKISFLDDDDWDDDDDDKDEWRYDLWDDDDDDDDNDDDEWDNEKMDIQQDIKKTRNQINEDYEDDNDEFIPQYTKRSYDKPRKESRRSPLEKSVSREYKALQKEISTWFTSDDTNEYEDYDEFENEDNPIGLFLDKLFNVNTEERKRLADAYDYRMGIRKKEKTTRYENVDDDDDENNLTVTDIFSEPINENDLEDSETSIDINATSTTTEEFSTGEKNVVSNLSGKNEFEIKLTWEERAEQVERIPPSGITAWGPQGEVKDAKDAREAAVSNALDEIREAEIRVHQMITKVGEAREQLSLLQADATLLKKRMKTNGNRRNNLISELKDVEIQITRSSRRLRKRQYIVKGATMEVQRLKKKNWALLSQFEVTDEILERNKN